MKKRQCTKKENNFFKIIFRILFKKLPEDDENTKYTTMAFSFLTSLIFWVLGCGLLFLSLFVFGYSFYYFIFILDWRNIMSGIVQIIYLEILVFVCFIISILMIGAAKEQSNGKRDYEKTISIFSALVSLVALIVSFIALINQ